MVEGLVFPEGPRWRGDTLWCSDIFGHRVLRVTADGEVATVAEIPTQPSGLGFLPDGSLLVVSMLDRRLLRIDGDRVTEAVDLSGVASHECNDMVVTADGRAYVGSIGVADHAVRPRGRDGLADPRRARSRAARSSPTGSRSRTGASSRPTAAR